MGHGIYTGYEFESLGLCGLEHAESVLPERDAVGFGGSIRTFRRDFLFLLTLTSP